MMRGWPVGMQCGKVLGRGVTLVLRQAILGIDRIPFHHYSIALNFRDDRGCRDRDRKCVPVNQRFLLDEDIQLHGIQSSR